MVGGFRLINDLIISWWTWGFLSVISVGIFIADLIVMTKYGASSLGKRVATIALIVGSFITNNRPKNAHVKIESREIYLGGR
ncbi:DUF456 domain-containing protein [Salipaludibacillus sp. LMS25]|uniref:DUF456 domain-containing protein n=1 Tax=Salipaludibacillus sp. LMS25 TaxID=2924031 RepID=UPI0020D125E1|nr:DUF456 domain-containing protein [Salipaludibacillus sp. LMS25]UTR15305.1 DUF456 domain-containing protein [Salipaludibacillus sp. LMS25]